MSKPDSKLVYISCHLISSLATITTIAGFLWLAYALKSGWVIWGLILCTSSYEHDFNKDRKAKGAEA